MRLSLPLSEGVLWLGGSGNVIERDWAWEEAFRAVTWVPGT